MALQQISKCGGIGLHLVRSGQLVSSTPVLASFSTSAVREEKKSYKLVVLGGGTGGCAAAHMFGRKLGRGKVAVVEPSDTHYLQPIWSLVGGGIKTFEQSCKPMGDVLPKTCDWIRDYAVNIDPDNCVVTTADGTELKYDYLVCAMGLKLDFNKIKGFPEAFEDPTVVSNYSKWHVMKTRPAIGSFTEGNAIFTFPNTPIKCPGAPQKIVYLADEILRKYNKRDKANIIYNTSLGVLFGVKKYADALWKVVEKRNITVNLRHNLIEVRPDKKEAVFENLDTKEEKVFEYSLLHVTPPMSTPGVLSKSPLADETGFATVNKETLQHTNYPNVFGIGDNTSVPTSRTAAAVASQTGVLKENLSAVMDGKPTGGRKYDGYTSCPLVTGDNKVIMAEFDWDGQPMETFPFDQGKERRTMFHLKRDVLPQIYWHMLIKGYWRGPKQMRKLLHLGKVN